MTPSGAVLTGTTALVAVIDGGLGALVFGVAAGATAYVVARRMPNRAVENVVKAQMAAWEDRIRNEDDPERKKSLQKQAATAEKSYRLRLQCDREYVRWSAAAIGLGVAMAPAAGLAILGVATRKHWMPYCTAVLDASRAEKRRREDTEAADAANVAMYVM